MGSEMQYKLLAKYKPPRVRKGDVLFDERHGEVVVVGFTGRLQWPMATLRNSHRVPILCGSLIKALHKEAAVTIAYWWEVSRHLVYSWKRSVKAPSSTKGTMHQRKLNAPTEKAHEAAIQIKRTREGRKRVGERKRQEWAARRKAGDPRAWSDQELALLGTDTDAAIAERLGKTVSAVATVRRWHKIPPVSKRTVTCQICGKVFKTNRRGQTKGRALCSDKCRRERNARRSREWRRRNS